MQTGRLFCFFVGMTRWKKTQYIALLICAAWLLMFQAVYCVFGIVNAYSHPVALDFLDLLGYIAMFLTVIVSLFTISASVRRLRQAHELS